MLKYRFIKYFSIFLLPILLACSSGDNGPTGPSLEDLISEGWTAFELGDYSSAATKFTEAISKDQASTEAFLGLGWSLFKSDNLSRANNEFTAGSSKESPTADLFAGGAFVLNALKRYANSNQRSENAISQDPAWQFSHGLSLDVNDLRIVRAENYFLLGDFANSLVEVRILNPNFNVDVLTSEGQAALAQEIERIKGLNKL